MPTPRLLGLSLGVPALLLLATFEPGALSLVPLYLAGVGAVATLDLGLAPGSRAFTIERHHEPRLSLGEPNPVEVRLRWVGPRRTGGGTRAGVGTTLAPADRRYSATDDGRWTADDRLGSIVHGLRSMVYGLLPTASSRPLRIWVRDEAPPEIPLDRVILEGTIAPGGEWIGRYSLRPLRRGDYRFGAATVRVESPLKLWILQHGYPIAAPAHVYPNLRQVRRYELLVRRGRLHEAGLRQARQFGSGTEFERLREYLPDDDFRRIAWNATARRGQPVTIEYEAERSQNLILLLDTGRLMGTPIGPMEKLDYAVNAALMLAYVAAQRDDRVGLLAFADRVRLYVPPARGHRQFQILLEALYRVRAEPIEPDHGRALTYLAARQLKRSLLVLFTDLAEAAEAAALVAHLARLARRHLPVCVTMSDPDLIGLAAAWPADSRRAYEKVVAQRLLDERRAILERLERGGTLALDVPAERLTAAIINRYLEIKARTRL